MAQGFMRRRNYVEGGNINCGTLTEIQEIHIDVFTPQTVDWDRNIAFFLTHAHTDHMEGLFDYFLPRLHSKCKIRRPKYRLYMDKITFHHVIFHIKRRRLDLSLIDVLNSLCHYEIIIMLEKNVRQPLHFTEEGRVKHCWVTPLSAGHCPGSLMLKFDTEREYDLSTLDIRERKPMQRILYTGDCRIRWNDLRYTKNLRENYDGPPIFKKIDVLYMDTTFLFEETDFPTRKSIFDSMKGTIISLNDSRPRDRQPRYIISMGGYLTNLYAVMRFFRTFETSVCVSKEAHEFCEKQSELKGVTIYNETCSEDNKCDMQFHMQHVSEYWDPQTLRSLQEHDFQIVLQANVPRKNFITEHFSPEGISTDGKRIFLGPYSAHLSPGEMKVLMAALQPTKVVPLVQPKGKSEDEVNDKLEELRSETSGIDPAGLANQDPDFPSFCHDFTGKNLWRPEADMYLQQ